MDILSPFIYVLCHSDWLFPESPVRTDVVHSGHAWSSLSVCTWHCFLHYLFLQSTNSLVSSWCDMLWQCLTVLFTPALLRTHSLVFFVFYETRRISLSPFISKASRRVSSFFLSVQLSQPCIATGPTSVFISCIFVEIGMLWLLHMFCSDAPIACPCLTWYGILSYTQGPK